MINSENSIREASLLKTLADLTDDANLISLKIFAKSVFYKNYHTLTTC